MTVYVVLEHAYSHVGEWERDEILGIYSTKELAKEVAEALAQRLSGKEKVGWEKDHDQTAEFSQKDGRSSYYFYLEEHEVETPNDVKG